MMRVIRGLRDAVLPPVLLFALVAIVWHGLVTAYHVKPYLVPGPLPVLQTLATSWPTLLRATGYTGMAAVIGLLSSVVLGTLIAFVFSQSRWIRGSCYPYALFLQTVPIVAIAPLIVHWFGRGFSSIVLTSIVISLFPMIANGTAGLLGVDPDLLDLFRLNNASRWQMLWKLRLPNAVPALCTGAKTSCGLAVVGAVVGEFFAGYGGRHFGLGYLILVKTDQLQMAELFGAVLASTLLSILMFGMVSRITAAILAHWYDVPEDQRP